MKKTVKKLAINKETLADLRKVNAGLYLNQDEFGAASAGPEQCWFSECASC